MYKPTVLVDSGGSGGLDLDAVFVSERMTLREALKLPVERWHEVFVRRVAEEYLRSAELLVRDYHGFAATIVLCSGIEYMARVVGDHRGDMTTRVAKWGSQYLESFGEIAGEVHSLYRHGLVHEGRVKKGSMISFEIEEPWQRHREVFIIHPGRLFDSVKRALSRIERECTRDTTIALTVGNRVRDDIIRDWRTYLEQHDSAS